MQRINTGLISAVSLAASSLARAADIPDHIPEPGSAKNRPGHNTPVAGGGSRERERRRQKMIKAQYKAEGRDYFDDENHF